MPSQNLDAATRTQIANIEKNSGKTFEEWIAIVNSSGLGKHGELVNFLKGNHGFTHGNANLVVHFAKQSAAANAEDATDLVTEQYKGKPKLEALYKKIIGAVSSFGNDIEIAPKKSYVSLRRKKQFAIIQPSTKTRIDVGLNLKGAKPGSRLEMAGSWNAMCTHRVKLEDTGAADAELLTWIRQAYEQAG